MRTMLRARKFVLSLVRNSSIIAWGAVSLFSAIRLLAMFSSDANAAGSFSLSQLKYCCLMPIESVVGASLPAGSPVSAADNCVKASMSEMALCATVGVSTPTVTAAVVTATPASTVRRVSPPET
jgi:hypothetical protein